MNLFPFIQHLSEAEPRLRIQGTLEPELTIKLADRKMAPVVFNIPTNPGLKPVLRPMPVAIVGLAEQYQ